LFFGVASGMASKKNLASSAQELVHEIMAGLQKSASSPALINAGASMSHVPKRATQHALFLASWEAWIG
jgi:hypothetical protein